MKINDLLSEGALPVTVFDTIFSVKIKLEKRLAELLTVRKGAYSYTEDGRTWMVDYWVDVDQKDTDEVYLATQIAEQVLLRNGFTDVLSNALKNGQFGHLIHVRGRIAQ